MWLGLPIRCKKDLITETGREWLSGWVSVRVSEWEKKSFQVRQTFQLTISKSCLPFPVVTCLVISSKMPFVFLCATSTRHRRQNGGGTPGGPCPLKFAEGKPIAKCRPPPLKRLNQVMLFYFFLYFDAQLIKRLCFLPRECCVDELVE